MKRVEDFTVLGQRWLNYKTYILELEASSPLPPISPGNFAEIEVPNTNKIFLRRPFSVYDVDYHNRIVSFFVKVVGEGTRVLGNLRKGEKVNVIYPLGNSFTVPESGNVLVVAGGSGVAPFILYGKELMKAGVGATFLFGARNADEIVLTEQYKTYGKVLVTTEDGSMGEAGLVTQHSLFKRNELNFDLIVTCGPNPMMKAVAGLARQKGIPCEASLENTMACGFGACLCCVTPTTHGNLCVCTDGPVFNVNELKWQI
ncbi:MAG TPA: dihydroorotate dehydrogenase electron transfer subunit [Bacteroidales bacterium]|nr:dihydroorotate dehydrogenase electron transfer subunit [Bacteroidales bacterium]HOX78541.1 dihydroorotate dehydrogenase electron transfer subunit [Bacteroidales bacterium]